MHIRPLLLTLLVALVAAPAAFASPAAGRFDSYVAPTGTCAQDEVSLDPATERSAMACLVNWARRKRGLSALRVVPALDRAAELKLADNVRCGAFSHTACGRPFQSVFRQAGYLSGPGSYAYGENLAWGQADLGTPRATLAAWLQSPHHRENLFNPEWREMGIAVAAPRSYLGYAGVSIWANEFGVRG